MPEFNPEQFSADKGNNMNPLLNKKTAKEENPLSSYFRQAKIYLTLPSGGKYYPDDCLDMPESGELPVMPMTAKDELALKTPDALLSGQATVDLIQSCIPNIKNAWGMPSLDIDACLIAIRIASYGEHMTITAKAPNTKTDQDYTIDLRQLLDRYTQAKFEDTYVTGEMTVTVRPLTYKEFSKVSMQTFEEQRLLHIVNTDDMEETKKLELFDKTFRKIRDITLGMVVNSVVKITILDGEQAEEVTEKQFISEFLENSDKKFFSALQKHVEIQKEAFSIPPMDVEANEEQLKAGAPEKFSVPITFDQSTFFA